MGVTMHRRVLGVSAALAAASLAAGLWTSSAAATQPVRTTSQGLVLHYAFETISNQTVDDLSGNGLTGHVVNDEGIRLRARSLSGYGYSIRLRGDHHQYVDVPSEPVLDVNTFTVAAWVRYTGVPNDATNGRWEVFEKAGAYWMNVRTDGHVRVGGFFGGCDGGVAWRYLDSSNRLPVNTWTHVAGTYDGSRLKVYVNGALRGSIPVSGRTCVSGEPLAVGAKNNPTKGLLEAFWDGWLDEVRIYDRALTRYQISRLAAR